MADLTITAANVKSEDPVGTLNVTGTKEGFAEVAITAGKSVYLDGTTVKLADNNASIDFTGKNIGIALNDAAAGQPVKFKTAGKITLGTGTESEIYVVSATAGGIAPAADLASGNTTVILGIGAGSNQLDMTISGTYYTKA